MWWAQGTGMNGFELGYMEGRVNSHAPEKLQMNGRGINNFLNDKGANETRGELPRISEKGNIPRGQRNRLTLSILGGWLSVVISGMLVVSRGPEEGRPCVSPNLTAAAGLVLDRRNHQLNFILREQRRLQMGRDQWQNR